MQGIGAAQDAARMNRVVGFYQKLPRGPAPEPKVSGPLTWYQKRYFGKNTSAARKDTFWIEGVEPVDKPLANTEYSYCAPNWRPSPPRIHPGILLPSPYVLFRSYSRPQSAYLEQVITRTMLTRLCFGFGW